MLISNAFAQTAAAAASPTDSVMQFLPIILMFIVLYFIMIRPQQKKAKEHKAMIDAITKGDEVVTQGGLAGRVAKVGEEYVTIEIAQNVEVQIQKGAIGLVLPKGTLKSL
ncbi:preprotein translocase subunit YajC [Propionivibrio limicola]|uniref:preprotein translocase subunit YajC n=1 Tax=Propionivibrio limicola TaxID=167645 RepID=UPI0012922D37|nr:preprotein translocase subunit YajC [Propionivibrio limicola]